MNAKTNEKFIIALCSLLLIYFVVIIIIFLQEGTHAEYSFIYNVIFAQLIALSTATLIIIIYVIRSLYWQTRYYGSSLSKIVILSDSNTYQSECSLINRNSVLICKADEIYFSFLDARFPTEEYALLNCVNNTWYIERSSDNQNVGIKHAGEQYVYKLKIGIPYKINRNDVVYIDGERLVVL